MMDRLNAIRRKYWILLKMVQILTYPNVNWFDEILKKNSMQSQYNINISGSALGKLRYFISGSYVNQGTLLKHQDIFEKNYGVKVSLIDIIFVQC